MVWTEEVSESTLKVMSRLRVSGGAQSGVGRAHVGSGNVVCCHCCMGVSMYRAVTGCFAWSQWQVAGEVLSAVAAAGRCDEPGLDRERA